MISYTTGNLLESDVEALVNTVNKSQMQWVIDGLADLRSFIKEYKVRSIAIPALGAGNGGLEWEQVKPHIEQALSDLDEVAIIVYEPFGHY